MAPKSTVLDYYKTLKPHLSQTETYLHILDCDTDSLAQPKVIIESKIDNYRKYSYKQAMCIGAFSETVMQMYNTIKIHYVSNGFFIRSMIRILRLIH